MPVDLVIHHSLVVDYFGTSKSLAQNVKREYEQNQERYRFLKWGQQAFSNFSVVPPGTGICHQVNLEYLAQTVWTSKEKRDGKTVEFAYPDTLVGTDSHTTMVNGLAVLGWGVGGIEAEVFTPSGSHSHCGVLAEIVQPTRRASGQMGINGKDSGSWLMARQRPRISKEKTHSAA